MKELEIPEAIKNSDAYKSGSAIGSMCVAQASEQQQLGLHIEINKQSGIMDKNFTALGD
jgi:hypothetical protein|tara:strand:+ start:571 stop:747 length:177 start_codon:yes stop_codon:yes gene_type:complete